MTRLEIVKRLMGAVLVVAVASCAGGGGDDGDDLGSGGGRRRGNAPAGDDAAALEPVLAELLERHDDIVNDALAQPDQAQDEDSEIVEDYLGLYVPDSEVADRVIAAWSADAEAGRSTHALETGYPAIRVVLAGAIESRSVDEVRFPTCSELRYATYDRDGNIVEMVPYREQPGEATAVRVDGEWRLQQLDSFEGQAACAPRQDTEG